MIKKKTRYNEILEILYCAPAHIIRTDRNISRRSLDVDGSCHFIYGGDRGDAVLGEDAPQMPYGYLTSLISCLIPPLWYRIITPSLNEWEQEYAPV